MSNESVKMFISWLAVSSNAPMPSVSITTIVHGFPSDKVPCKGWAQIQIPLVQGFIVEPTLNPS